MEFWISWMAIGLLLMIIEIFFVTLDFLALGIGCVLVGVSVKFLGWNNQNREMAMGLFFIYGIILLIISRTLILPIFRDKFLGKKAMSVDSVIGEKLIVLRNDSNFMVNYNGVYRTIKGQDKLVHGDTVEVVDRQDNTLIVKKVM